MPELFISNLKINTIEGVQIYGTVDVLFGQKNYRATYTFDIVNGASIEGFTCLDTNMYSMSGVFLLGEYDFPVAQKIIEFIESVFIHNPTKYHSLISSDVYSDFSAESQDRLCPPLWQGQHHKQTYSIHPILKDNDHPYLYWYAVIYESSLYRVIQECKNLAKWQSEMSIHHAVDIRELSTYTPPKSWREEGTKEYVVPIIRNAVKKGEITPI